MAVYRIEEHDENSQSPIDVEFVKFHLIKVRTQLNTIFGVKRKENEKL